MDLNMVYPKDLFPLPHIDLTTDAIARYEMLNFMDECSDYNQILMHPNDQDKKTFITKRGIYYHKVMPFDLKNVGSTCHRLMNKMFANKLGKSIEVYIDDMLVKSE